MPIVLTIDQRGGTEQDPESPNLVDEILVDEDPTDEDLVDEWIKTVNEQYGDRLTRPFERTVGDETQALMNDAAVAIELALRANRDRAWWVGIGVGKVKRLRKSSRASRGPVFRRARKAVDAAKRRRSGIAVRGPDRRRQVHVETVLDLLAALIEHRSQKAWEAVDLRRELATSGEVAAVLGVSRQAIGERLRRANAEEENRGIKLAVDLLQELDQHPDREDDL